GFPTGCGVVGAITARALRPVAGIVTVLTRFGAGAREMHSVTLSYISFPTPGITVDPRWQDREPRSRTRIDTGERIYRVPVGSRPLAAVRTPSTGAGDGRAERGARASRAGRTSLHRASDARGRASGGPRGSSRGRGHPRRRRGALLLREEHRALSRGDRR